MTVAELIAELQKLPQGIDVVLQKDAEGNGFSILDSVDANAIYTPDTQWSGSVVSTEWTADEADFDTEHEWEKFKRDNPRCCVLCPTN